MFDLIFPKWWSTLKKLIWLKAAALSSAVVKTVTAAIVHIKDALAGPAQNVTIAIEPVQSGTGDPSLDNVRPISGWTGANVTRTGKNLWNKAKYNSYLGYFGSVQGGGEAIVSNYGHTITWITCAPNTTYTVSRVRTVGNERFQVGWAEAVPTAGSIVKNIKKIVNDVPADVGKTMSLTITTGSTAQYLVLWAWWNSSIDPAESLQIELGSTATAYEAYQGTTYSITFPDAAGTVYGGTLDVTNGVLTVTHKSVDMGSLSWSAAGTRFFSSGLAAEIKIPANNDTVADLLCSVYSAANYSKVYADTVDSAIAVVATPAGSAGQVSARDHSASGKTGAEFKIYVTGQTLVYELATPQTYQLTPQEVQLLAGENNLLADTGNTTLTYLADGRASDVEALGILLAGRYHNGGAADEATDAEALDILLGR